MKKRTFITAALSAIIGLAVAYFLLVPRTLIEVPNISLNVIDGRKIDLQSLRGKSLLVTFWATTCSTCLQEMPHLIELYDELNKEGLEILGIAMSYDPPNRVVALSEQKNIPYPIALDIDGSAAKAFGDVSVTPTSFLISPGGEIIQQKTRGMNLNNLRIKIKELLSVEETTFSYINDREQNALV